TFGATTCLIPVFINKKTNQIGLGHLPYCYTDHNKINRPKSREEIKLEEAKDKLLNNGLNWEMFLFGGCPVNESEEMRHLAKTNANKVIEMFSNIGVKCTDNTSKDPEIAIDGIIIDPNTKIIQICYSKNITEDADIIEEGGKLVEQEGLWRIIIYGEIKKDIIDHIKNAIILTFDELHFKGKYPEIRIADGNILHNNEIVPALFEHRENGKKIMRLSVAAAKNTSAFKEGISENIILAGFAAHEATHYVQSKNMVSNFEEINTNDRKTRLTKVAGHPLEKEANKIAEIVVKKLYNAELKFVE
ncbi:MAG: hypothetical protein V1910_00190, partial [bacterium]